MFNLIPESYDLQDVLAETGDMLHTLGFLLETTPEHLDGRFKSGFSSMVVAVARCIDDAKEREVMARAATESERAAEIGNPADAPATPAPALDTPRDARLHPGLARKGR